MLEHKKKRDVLIVCALLDEFKQITSINEGLSEDGWMSKTTTSGWSVADAKFISVNGVDFFIRATWAPNMGREAAAAITHKMLLEMDFVCIAMTGICAGRRGKVELGDVIFADRLWSYDAGKIVKEGQEALFQGDMLQYRPSQSLVQKMQAFEVDDASWPIPRPVLPLELQENWVLRTLMQGEAPSEQIDFETKCPDWPHVLDHLLRKQYVSKPLQLTAKGLSQAQEIQLFFPKDLPAPAAFSVHVAPLATGAAVVEDSALFSKLSSAMRKVLGVDMEATAMAAIGEIQNIPVIVAKAVSDFGDEFKDDRYRHFASQASARCMVQFLRENADLFLQKKTKNTVNRENENELIAFLAEEYPDVADARALWRRAGGKNGDIPNNPRPKDMWLTIWKKSLNGAVVTPSDLLKQLSVDFPNNPMIESFLASASTLN